MTSLLPPPLDLAPKCCAPQDGVERAAAAEVARLQDVIAQLTSHLEVAQTDAVSQKDRGDGLDLARRGEAEAAAQREAAVAKERCDASM